MELSCSYDDGYFDKDEQGWVTNGTGVSTLADGTIRIRRWGDRNGLDPYEQLTETRVAQVFDELKLVKLEQWPWYFDLEKQRLVDANKDVMLPRRAAEGDWMTAARITSAMSFVSDLVATLGARVTLPRFEGWPARETSNRFEFTGMKLPLEGGFTLELRYRPAISPTDKPELCVWLSSAQRGASVVVTERGEYCVSVRGPLELHAAARAAAEQWRWC